MKSHFMKQLVGSNCIKTISVPYMVFVKELRSEFLLRIILVGGGWILYTSPSGKLIALHKVRKHASVIHSSRMKDAKHDSAVLISCF